MKVGKWVKRSADPSIPAYYRVVRNLNESVAEPVELTLHDLLTKATLSINLTPAEARDLAAKLIDMADDQAAAESRKLAGDLKA